MSKQSTIYENKVVKLLERSCNYKSINLQQYKKSVKKMKDNKVL